MVTTNQLRLSPPSPPAPSFSVDPFSLASRWRSAAEWNQFMDEMDAEPSPTHINTVNSSGLFHIVSPDKLSVKYPGGQLHGHDVGVVQGDCAAPTRRMVYYFELTVKDAGAKGQVSIGFTMEGFKMRRQPGWEVNSCGYHGDDGCLYRGQKGEPFGPKFTTGDTVGAGINYATQEFFFTKNAKIVGTVPKDIKVPLYPTIAVHSQNEEVMVNFGNRPFLFDIEGFILEERAKLQEKVEKLNLQPNFSNQIVRSYLLHYGYQNTLNSLDVASESTYPSDSAILENGFVEPRDSYALNHRCILRQLIKNGDIDSAFKNLREWYPQILQDGDSTICFLLHSQRFIEYIRAGQLKDAISYAQLELAKYFNVKTVAALLEDVVGLLAYQEPLESGLAYLLDVPQRDFVADAVNAAVLSTNPEYSESSMQSCLERLLRQLTVCSLLRRELNDDQGEQFFLHKELSNHQRAKV